MADADPTDPGQTAIGMDFEISAVDMDLRVNDVPVFDPAIYFSIDAAANSQINLNPAFQEGKNVISVRVRRHQGEAVPGFDPGVRLRFGYWPAGTFPEMFSDRPFVADIVMAPPAEGLGSAPPLVVIASEAPGQELMRVTDIDQAARLTEDGWAQFDITVDVKVRLPKFAWMQKAVSLNGSVAERAQVLAQLARAHDALVAGPGATADVLGPYLDQKAGAVGMDTGSFAEMSFGFLFDPERGFAVDPFETSDRPLALFGNGRVATVLPVPVTFTNADLGRQGTLYLYYWQDAQGQWHVIH